LKDFLYQFEIRFSTITVPNGHGGVAQSVRAQDS
jgi:hypothetical protein